MSIKKLSQIRKNDPHFAREVAKYEQPLPSREYVLQVVVVSRANRSVSTSCALCSTSINGNTKCSCAVLLPWSVRHN